MSAPQARPAPRDLLICACGAALLLVAVALARGIAFWSTSDGVYALTAREVLHGLALYEDVAAAQPPPVFLAGAALLAADDSLSALRAGTAALSLVTAVLVWLAVLRLTGRRRLAIAAGVLTPLMPVTLHENGLLTPENLGAPLVMGLALAAARPWPPAAVGALAAATIGCKLSFVLPALAVVAVSPGRRRSLMWLAGALVALAAAGTVVYGGALWDSVVVAQAQAGSTPPREFAGLMSQALWNLAPLLALSLIAVSLGRQSRDPLLLRTLAAAAAGSLALALSLTKLGSYVNVVQVAEAPLVALSASALAWLSERAGAPRRLLVALAAVAVLMIGAQSASLLLRPDDPHPYTRPLAESGPRRLMSPEAVAAAAAAARRCPREAPYPGIPFLAFVADRRVPGDQPDLFIVGTHPNKVRFATRIANDQPPCPRRVPVVDARGIVRLTPAPVR